MDNNDNTNKIEKRSLIVAMISCIFCPTGIVFTKQKIINLILDLEIGLPPITQLFLITPNWVYFCIGITTSIILIVKENRVSSSEKRSRINAIAILLMGLFLGLYVFAMLLPIFQTAG